MRRMKFSDLIVMIAATACGLALCRIHEAIIQGKRWSEGFLVDLAPLIAMWTLAFAMLRLRPPRPRLRRLFRQSGMAAGSTSLVVLTVFLGPRLLGPLQTGGSELGPERAMDCRPEWDRPARADAGRLLDRGLDPVRPL